MNTDPLTEAELNFLDEMLQKYGNDDSIFDVSELDGFLTAIVSGPETIFPSQWFPAFWGGAGNEPEWESEAEMQRFMDLLIQHMNNNGMMLIEYPDEFEALFYQREVDGKAYTIVDEWCAGFMRGVELDESAWATAPKKLLQEQLAIINMFADVEFTPELEKLSDIEFVELQNKVEPAVRAIHAYFLAQRSDEAPEPHVSPVKAVKVGRNEPCHCGSGKKYKHCCLQ